MNDLIYRKDVIEDYIAGFGLTIEDIKKIPAVEAEPITLEKAIDYLHSIGWMQEHDRIMTEPKHGRWIKMSDADGVYYACSECGNELPRVVTSFNPQFDLFPKLKCIDKTTYCPNCGAKMDGEENDF